MMPSIVSPVKQNVPVRWRPFRPTAADANEACTRALRPAEATVPRLCCCCSTIPIEEDDDDDVDEDDDDGEDDVDSGEEAADEEAAAITTELLASTTLVGSGAARINRSNESILALSVHVPASFSTTTTTFKH